EDDVDLLGLLVSMAERMVLARLDDLVRDAQLGETEVLPGEARLLVLGEAALDGSVVEVGEVLDGVVGHRGIVTRLAVRETSLPGERGRAPLGARARAAPAKRLRGGQCIRSAEPRAGGARARRR